MPSVCRGDDAYMCLSMYIFIYVSKEMHRMKCINIRLKPWNWDYFLPFKLKVYVLCV